eukprot:1443863-Prymnesium_polylepis.1
MLIRLAAAEAPGGGGTSFNRIRPAVSALPYAEVQALVDERCERRRERDFSAADALKERLEACGVRLQDEVGGGTCWSLAPPPHEAGTPSSSAVLALARRAHRRMLSARPPDATAATAE